MNANFGIVDLAILVGSMLVCVLIGFYFSNKNETLDAYMLGDRKLSVLPVALSLMSSCLSALTLLGASAELYYQGPSYAFVAIAVLLSGPVTAHTILPILYQMDELSLYKYLHLRYGLTVKYIVTSIYMLQMIFYNSVVLYLPGMALWSVLGVSRFYSILIIGLMCVLYSGFGGLKAVVWTDVFQAILMCAAVLVVAVLGTHDAGGIKQVLRVANDQGRLDLHDFFNVDLRTRHTLWNILLGSTLMQIYLMGANQVQIQRALSLRSLRQIQRAFMLCAMFGAFIVVVASYLGAVLVAAYRSCDPYMSDEIARPDIIIVHYVANRLAKIDGSRGIFVAGVFSATLSTLSSSASSMSALALEDYVKPLWNRFGRNQMSAKQCTWLAKFFAISFSVTCVLMTYVIERANSRLLQATTTMFGAVGVPLLATFALGIFSRIVNAAGILAALVPTLTLGIYITVHQTFYKLPLEPQMPVIYEEKCAALFNMTMPASKLASLSELIEWDQEFLHQPQAQIPFSLEQISYMTFPVVQFVLMVLISTIVSALTGGLKHQVDDHLLLPMMRSSRHKVKRSSNSYNVTLSDKKLFDHANKFDPSVDLESKLTSRLEHSDSSELNRTHRANWQLGDDGDR